MTIQANIISTEQELTALLHILKKLKPEKEKKTFTLKILLSYQVFTTHAFELLKAKVKEFYSEEELKWICTVLSDEELPIAQALLRGEIKNAFAQYNTFTKEKAVSLPLMFVMGLADWIYHHARAFTWRGIFLNFAQLLSVKIVEVDGNKIEETRSRGLAHKFASVLLNHSNDPTQLLPSLLTEFLRSRTGRRVRSPAYIRNNDFYRTLHGFLINKEQSPENFREESVQLLCDNIESQLSRYGLGVFLNIPNTLGLKRMALLHAQKRKHEQMIFMQALYAFVIESRFRIEVRIGILTLLQKYFSFLRPTLSSSAHRDFIWRQEESVLAMLQVLRQEWISDLKEATQKYTAIERAKPEEKKREQEAQAAAGEAEHSEKKEKESDADENILVRARNIISDERLLWLRFMQSIREDLNQRHTLWLSALLDYFLKPENAFVFSAEELAEVLNILARHDRPILFSLRQTQDLQVRDLFSENKELLRWWEIHALMTRNEVLQNELLATADDIGNELAEPTPQCCGFFKGQPLTVNVFLKLWNTEPGHDYLPFWLAAAWIDWVECRYQKYAFEGMLAHTLCYLSALTKEGGLAYLQMRKWKRDPSDSTPDPRFEPWKNFLIWFLEKESKRFGLSWLQALAEILKNENKPISFAGMSSEWKALKKDWANFLKKTRFGANNLLVLKTPALLQEAGGELVGLPLRALLSQSGREAARELPGLSSLRVASATAGSGVSLEEEENKQDDEDEQARPPKLRVRATPAAEKEPGEGSSSPSEESEGLQPGSQSGSPDPFQRIPLQRVGSR